MTRPTRTVPDRIRTIIDREKLTDGAYALGWKAVRKLPEPAAKALGRRIADTVWKRRGKGILRLEANLARVVPDATPQRLAQLSRAGMRSYLRYWMESFRLPAWSKERIRGGFAPADVHHLVDGLKSGRGVILALPHMGNYDLAGAWVTTKLGVPFTTVAERLKPESLYDRFVAYREGLGMEVLPHTGGAAFGILARRLRAGGLVCLVADRDLSASGIEVKFFGEAAKMPAGPAMLAVQTGAMLLPVTLWYDESPVMRGRVHPEIEVPQTGTRAEKAAAMTQMMADAFASGIADHPQDWHMLQRLWLGDLEPREPARRTDVPDGGAPGTDGAPAGARRTERS
ncbi:MULTISPECIES: phosphatidylinositol mannoside acyltransferase [Streptomyces]|uniref:Phosphatidylinositol mannoside acyltransferase n=1 Tax=Streptomyces rimosus subsp. rimosus TaxID=132474 RepID=A0ABY3ZBF4_STRRM|nr:MULTISPECIES: phosphatidylinositol mannoside acyltransferase [Streptomyces]KOG72621.1 lipid A biosynthesis acyltransferase [Kitasatospora aureofaciens]KEF22120.1 lipid A biosynthesis acyltransferase [Streptomyces rimosus]KUJ30055.1 lipid A biosynthesis acyltransferase [Streptomyces rimosus subsp. rimosus]UNZ07210.1 Phosphatidylinositol mannoside acyltransferase [Streptomyces rimosus subsp. rimosus]UTH98663.1 Phosphatidylinositol mannoside acyltransferase [Streptomyces rimosus subsp. rimosus